jgi:hypothetical protein
LIHAPITAGNQAQAWFEWLKSCGPEVFFRLVLSLAGLVIGIVAGFVGAPIAAAMVKRHTRANPDWETARRRRDEHK